MESIDSNCMEQLIDFPTHVCGNTLDVLFTQSIHNVTSIKNIGNIGNSDHVALLIDLAVNKAVTQITEYSRNWRTGDKDGLRRYLYENDWDRLLVDEEPWQILNQKLERNNPQARSAADLSSTAMANLMRRSLKLRHQKSRRNKTPSIPK